MILVTGNKGFIGSKLCEKLGDYIGIDLKDNKNILTYPLPENIDLIYHLASQTSVEESNIDPVNDMDNIKMLARLVKHYPNAKIIFSSSCASMEIASPYGFSKWACNEYLKLFHKNHVICVFPNIFGGGKGVIDAFKGKNEVTIYGDGNQKRDYVHVDDIVDGLLKAKDWDCGTYFMGSGQSITVNELAEGKIKHYEKAERFGV